MPDLQCSSVWTRCFFRKRQPTRAGSDLLRGNVSEWCLILRLERIRHHQWRDPLANFERHLRSVPGNIAGTIDIVNPKVLTTLVVVNEACHSPTCSASTWQLGVDKRPAQRGNACVGLALRLREIEFGKKKQAGQLRPALEMKQLRLRSFGVARPAGDSG